MSTDQENTQKQPANAPGVEFKPAFQCRRCGECCGIVPFSRAEYKRIKKLADKRGIEFVKNKEYGRTLYFQKEVLRRLHELKEAGNLSDAKLITANIICLFKTGTNADGVCSCQIYNDRPAVCRAFGGPDQPPHFQCPIMKREQAAAAENRRQEYLNKNATKIFKESK